MSNVLVPQEFTAQIMVDGMCQSNIHGAQWHLAFLFRSLDEQM